MATVADINMDAPSNSVRSPKASPAGNFVDGITDLGQLARGVEAWKAARRLSSTPVAGKNVDYVHKEGLK